MINLENFILESQFSVEELHKDYEAADGATGQEKKDLIQKYNVNSKKTKDIRMAILIKLQELRKNKKEFTEEDLRDFSRMYESDAQMIEQLKKESIEFATYLRDNQFEYLKKRKLDKYANVTSLNSYMLSIADKYQIKKYQKINDYVVNEDPDVKKKNENDKDMLNILNKKLTEELSDFKQEYLKRVEESAKYSYDDLPDLIKRMEKTLEKLKEEAEQKKSEAKGYMARWYADEPVRKQESKISQKKAILKRYPTKKSFVDACLEDAEKTFRGNVDALAHRVYEKKFDVEKIKVSNVKDDPKIFKLMIEDGTKKLYCRSILAAEFSTKMIPHFRFIMTDRK